MNRTMISTSVLKGRAVYGDLLLNKGYSHDQIDDMAVSEFLNYERAQLGEPTPIFLLAIKKILLYAIPVIAPRNSRSKRGIQITAQFTTDCVELIAKSKVRWHRLVFGDKYILLGFVFPRTLISHLSISVFQWKYYYQYPKKYKPHPLDLSHISGLEKIQAKDPAKVLDSAMYLIQTSHYENPDLYNQILRSLRSKLEEIITANTSIRYETDWIDQHVVQDNCIPRRVAPLNDSHIVSQLNTILERHIDPTYSISYYDALHSTGNWLLYNQIYLYGYDSPAAASYLARLAYAKSENAKVFVQSAKEAQSALLQTRAEKIAREQYPYYFDSGDRRGLFTKFSRFSLNRLPGAHRKKIELLLEKDLARQHALIHNKCSHLLLLKQLRMVSAIPMDILDAYNKLEPFIDFDRKVNEEHAYQCKVCRYSLLCEHEVDFYSEIKILKDSAANQDNDIFYIARQIIINRFKQLQSSIDRTNTFAYHCRYCAQELGHSDDMIQFTRRDTLNLPAIDINNPYRNIAYITLVGIISNNIDPMVLSISKNRIVQAFITSMQEHIEDISFGYQTTLSRKGTETDYEDTVEMHTKLSALILGLCAMIALNINVLKSGKQLLVNPKAAPRKIRPDSGQATSNPELSDASTDDSSGDESDESAVSGGSIKTEFATAFAIVRNSPFFKATAVSEDKVKTMLLEYYRRIAKDISDLGDMTVIMRSNEDRIIREIVQSPVYAYLQHIAARNDNSVIQNRSFGQVMGLEITKATRGNLYQNVIADRVKPKTDRERYLHESYASIYTFLTQGKYLESETTSEPSEFIRQYELNDALRIHKLMHNPMHTIPEINSREVSFTLLNLNVIYCHQQPVLTRHKWKIGACEICGIQSSKVSAKYNDEIFKLIDNRITEEALFDLYTNVCPIADTHVYADEQVTMDSRCTQCNATKRQLAEHDPKYFKQYVSKFNKQQSEHVKELTDELTEICYFRPYIPLSNPELTNIDENQLIALNNQLVRSLANAFDVPAESFSELIPTSLDAYIRLIYERYAYISNLSHAMIRHPDGEFYELVKKLLKGGIPKDTFPNLPTYDYREYSIPRKRHHLFTLLQLLTQSDIESVRKLGQFLGQKILAQETRYKEFNFAKLKSVSIETHDLDSMDMPDEEEEEEEDLFMSYDIDMDDMEDNLDGDLD